LYIRRYIKSFAHGDLPIGIFIRRTPQGDFHKDIFPWRIAERNLCKDSFYR
jgi:hypothetical protein